MTLFRCILKSHRYYKQYVQQSSRYFASSSSNQTKVNNTKNIPLPHHYQTLNIESDASMDEIKKSYNNLMKQWHPDLYISKSSNQQNEAQQKFLSIREAYEIIINHNQSTAENSVKSKLDIQKAHSQKQGTNGFAAGRRTPKNAQYSYYTWGKKVYEAQEERENKMRENEEEEEEEEEPEIRYSEQYKLKQSYIGKAMEDLYDWMIFLYQRNPSWMQFFLISAMCAGLIQCLWHFMNPNIGDSDPDRIWNVFKANKKNQGSGYLPSQSAAMPSTPNLASLQPHFKGHTLYEIDGNNVERNHEEEEENEHHIEQESAFALFTKLNINSTVNRDSYKRKREGAFKEVKTKEQSEKKKKKNIRDTKRKMVVDNGKKRLELKDIPSELRSSPIGILMASQAFDNREIERIKGNDNEYDWTSVIQKFQDLNTANC